ncbi:hypothetical protein Tco_0524365 [Tanacetum coccineum]
MAEEQDKQQQQNFLDVELVLVNEQTELITPDLICPSTYQLLRNSSGDFEPDLSFDKSAFPERLFSLARVSLAEASKPITIYSNEVVMLFSIFKQQHDDNMELEEVIRESKKRKKEANLATWKGNDVIEIESSNDETIFSGDDDTLDDT